LGVQRIRQICLFLGISAKSENADIYLCVAQISLTTASSFKFGRDTQCFSAKLKVEKIPEEKK